MAAEETQKRESSKGVSYQSVRCGPACYGYKSSPQFLCWCLLDRRWCCKSSIVHLIDVGRQAEREAVAASFKENFALYSV